MRTEARGTSVIDSIVAVPFTTLASASMSHASPLRPNASTGPSAAARPPISAGILRSRYALFAVLSIGGLFWDLWSKWAVFDWLKANNQHTVWKGIFLGIPIDFELATTFNHGALWGMGQGQTWLFASLSVLAIGVLVYFLWTGQAVESWWLTIVSGLLLAGTLGNLYDRLGLHGWKNDNGLQVYAVRDFLDFVFFNGGFHWATFNFADSYLVTGAIMLALHSFRTPQNEPEKPKPVA